jgi:hypothetical protein
LRRNKSRPNKKDIRERMNWSGEEINFADSVNTFVREFLFPQYKFIGGGWQNYVFPFGEKLIAPEMQCIVHAVVFKTKRNKVELQNKVDK